MVPISGVSTQIAPVRSGLQRAAAARSLNSRPAPLALPIAVIRLTNLTLARGANRLLETRP